MFDDLKKEIKNILDSEDFENTEDIYMAARDNSVGAKPARNKRKVTLTEKGKRVLAAASVVLVLTSGISIGIGTKNKLDQFEQQMQTNAAYHILMEDYSGYAVAKHIPGTNTIYYEHSEIASKIKLNKKIFDQEEFNKDLFKTEQYNVEKFDEAIYAVWLSMAGEDQKQPLLANKNMEMVFQYLGYPDSFEKYLLTKGFYDEKEPTKVDIDAYKAHMTERVHLNDKGEAAKGLR